MATTGDQSQLEGESYSEYMDRLYRAEHYTKQADSHQERRIWTFRVPDDLARKALAFMRAENMSVTKYLTFAMHQLHTKNK